MKAINAPRPKPTSVDTEQPVPRWARRVARAIPWVLLPQCLWRLPFGLRFEMGLVGDEPMPNVWISLPYVLTLSVLTEALGLLCFGLVRGWGEVAPGWLPFVGGKRIPPYAAIIPATLGGLAATAFWTPTLLSWFGVLDGAKGFANVWWSTLAQVCIAPGMLWGPMVLALAYAYYVRRCRRHPDEYLGAEWVGYAAPVLDLNETALHQVRRLGFAPEDVRHVVLTHLDRDHAGGLADLPHATVHVHKAEYEAGIAGGADRYRAAQLAHGPRWATYASEQGDPWFGFDAVCRLDGLPEEILLVPLGGHTEGHSAVAVDTGERWLLHAGDAYFYHGEVDPDAPRSHPLLDFVQLGAEVDRPPTRTRPPARHRGRSLLLSRPLGIPTLRPHEPRQHIRPSPSARPTLEPKQPGRRMGPNQPGRHLRPPSPAGA
ncbi:MBL fold metallo-hydrolase [Embleya sp. NPDC005575]|uniref:MBL fold metallo-hydrolase n=1 Tax=Embleya sp. NPDC005575 TaxID=3156892 RepID=UPI0033A1F4A8